MSERLTLVVFKDHLSSRTLTVRLAWLRAFGLALLSVIGLAVIAAALFFNAYRKTIATGSVANTIRLEELEKDSAETKAAYESLKNQTLSGATGSAALAGGGNSFSLLPAESVLEKLPPPETLPFRLEAIKAQWKGSTLQIRSAIEYSKEDGGNQQGHFIIFVRGPQSLSAYPDGVFDAAGTATLIKPDAGEFFSVSRYREIKAEFGPFSRRDEIQSIEILIFDQKKRLIFQNRIGLESSAAKTPVPVKRVEPTSTQSEEDATDSKPETPSPKSVTAPVKAKPAAPAPKAVTAPATPAEETSAPAGDPAPAPVETGT
jgi:hypothetical protein